MAIDRNITQCEASHDDTRRIENSDATFDDREILDPDLCYRALLSRDPRFDGRFFTGVTTTGIYCRPICPARTPKLQNVRFFVCAAAAEEAEFRPCRRCRPDAAPGTPAWLGTSATVSRALRLIAEGALDGESVERLAERLGVGPRHLRRLFALHLGTSPAAIAATRRTHFARKLIDETRLPMTAIALDAGFSSVRRFNASIRQTFGRSPTELRRKVRSLIGTSQSRSSTGSVSGELALRLPFRPPLDWPALTRFLALRATPGVEAVDEQSYRRTIRIGDAAGVIEVQPVAGRCWLRLSVWMSGSTGLLHVVERVRRMFDLNSDPLAIDRRLSEDPRLAPLVAAQPGLRVPGAWDPFELAVRAILGQQVSVKGATTMAGRLAARFGTSLTHPMHSDVTRVFPKPEALADADLTTIGLTTARSAAIRGLARAVCEGRLKLDAAWGADRVETELTRLPGIGPWTAQYVAMRGLQEPDAFLPGDLGLRRAVSVNGKLPTQTALLEMAEPWRPWRAYAAMHLWMTGNESTELTIERRSINGTHGIARGNAAGHGRAGRQRTRVVCAGL